MHDYHIALIPHSEIYTIVPLLMMLDNSIAEDTLRSRLNDMCQQGYECVGVYDGDRLIGISGLWLLTKYYVGRHMEPDNVFIHPDYRSDGVGEKLMQWIYDYARSKGCVASELNCYVSNDKGIRFWIRQGYKILGFHMQKQLK